MLDTHTEPIPVDGTTSVFSLFIVLELRARRTHILSLSLSSLLTRDEEKNISMALPGNCVFLLLFTS